MAWCNPDAVRFARGMVEAISGCPSPCDLTAASEVQKADIGVWVHYWVNDVTAALDNGRRDQFMERCFRDVSKKRKVKSIRNLGRVARAKIVPGILKTLRQIEDRITG
jgi:hypothetical protein